MNPEDPIHDGWAPPVHRLERPDAPDDALNINVGGRRVAGPVQGFGRLWKKTYRVSVGDRVEPADVVATWRRDFGTFWPPGNRFYGPITGLEPGEVALLNLSMPGGLELSTGVLMLYADDEGFTLMTPEGHQPSHVDRLGLTIQVVSSSTAWSRLQVLKVGPSPFQPTMKEQTPMRTPTLQQMELRIPLLLAQKRTTKVEM